RDGNDFPFAFGIPLPGRRLQHEATCVALQSLPITLQPGAAAVWHFFALYEPDHRAASSDDDLVRLEGTDWMEGDGAAPATNPTRRSLVQDGVVAQAEALSRDALAKRYPERLLEEYEGAELRSFFTPDPPHNRHVVLRSKELAMTRRHGAVLRSGSAMLPDESTLSVTCWMHGVFAAQLTIGNTSFHK